MLRAESGVAVAMRPIVEGMADLAHINPIGVIANAVMELDSRVDQAPRPADGPERESDLERRVSELAVASNSVRVAVASQEGEIRRLGVTVFAMETRMGNLETAVGGLTDRIGDLETKVDEKFGAIDQKFEAIDQRFEQIDQRFEAMDRKFDLGFEKMTNAMAAGFEELGRRIGRIEASGKVKK